MKTLIEHKYPNGYVEPKDNQEIYESWEKIGFLIGLNEVNAQELSLLFEKTVKIVANSDKYVKDFVIILPIIRRIYSICRGLTDELKDRFKDNVELQNKALSLINLESIIDRVYYFGSGFIPSSYIFFSNIDIEAELVCLFAKEEAFSLYKKAIV